MKRCAAAFAVVSVVAAVCAADVLTATARHGRVFRLHLNSSLLTNSTDLRPSDEMRFSASLEDGPDLPRWLTYAASKQHRTGLLYGVPPPHIQQWRLEVIATNKRTYETGRHLVLLYVEEEEDPSGNEVQMKINNMDPVKIFSNSRLARLKEVYEQVLWPQSAGHLQLSWLEVGSSSVPPLPHQPSGALLRLASSAPFSPQLRSLQHEVRPLWARVPCPRDFKRSSTERHFRQRGFQMDWCQFKLFQGGSLSLAADPPTTSSTPEPGPPADHPALGVLPLPLRASVPVRSYTLDFLATICLPLLVALLLCGALTCILCCQGEHLRRPTEIQMVQYADGSQTGTLRSQTGTMRSQTGTLRSQTSTLRRAGLQDVSSRLAEQAETRQVTPRLTPYPELAGSPDSGGFSHRQLQPPPYTANVSRRS